MKGVFGVLGLVAVATVAVSDKSRVVGAGAATPAEKVLAVSREAHYLLQKHNEEVIDQLEKLINAALVSARSKGEEDSEDSKRGLAAKLEAAMVQVDGVIQNARQYATREEELLAKADIVGMAMASNQKTSPEFLENVREYADAHLRAEEAGRAFLRSVGVLLRSVVSEELSRAFQEEDRGVEVIQRVTEAAEDVTKRVGEDSQRRFEDLGQAVKMLVLVLKQYVH